MIEIQAETIIRKSPQEVMSFVADFENAPQWQTGVIHSEMVTPGPIRAGSRFEEQLKVAFWEMKATSEVTRFEPPALMAIHTTSTGPIEYGCEFRFDPVPDGTRVRLNGEARLKGIWKALQPLLAADLRKESQGELDRLKLVLEGTPSESAVKATS